MRIHNLYSDADGVSHFRDVEVVWAEERNCTKYSKRLPAAGVIFSEASPAYDLDWHPAPRRQYVINLEGAIEVTAGDGEVRIIGPGDVMLVEDTTGKGHLSKAVGGRMRRSVTVAVD